MVWICEQVKFYLELGVLIDVKVVWYNCFFEVIIQEVVSEKYDLLLKMVYQYDKLEVVIFILMDWYLLCKCFCLVWMVKDQLWLEGGKVLVVVNFVSEENYYNIFNEKLVCEMLLLVEEVNYIEVYLIGVYLVMLINIVIELLDFDFSVYNDVICGQYLLVMKVLWQKFGIDEKFIYVEKGLFEEVILDFVEYLQVGIVVLGMVGCIGLLVVFFGNIVEQVVDYLCCDLLVLKLEVYQMLVELDDDDDD